MSAGISQILDQIVKERVPEYNGIAARVTSVDPSTKTCDVEDLDGGIMTKVRLIADNTTGVYLVPKINSVVIVHMISDQDYYVSMFSQLDSITLLDGSYGGLTKTQELKSQLDKLNAQLKAVTDTLSTWTVAPGDGGAALKAAFAIAISGKPAGTFTAIESGTITHGV